MLFRSDAMEAAGIEPASADAPVRVSTGLAHVLSFARTAGTWAAYRRTSHPSVSRLRRLALPWRRARFLTPLPEPRAESGATRRLVLRRRVRDYDPHLHWSRLFYEADRGPRPAAQPENRPRRDLVAPVCVFAASVAPSTRLQAWARRRARKTGAGARERDRPGGLSLIA